MSEKEYVIFHIVQHATHMKSIFGFSSSEYYTEKELRGRYKKLALLVHPDKCKSDGAEEAFKILNNALETLILRLPEAFQEKTTTNETGDSDAKRRTAQSPCESGKPDNFSKCDGGERHEKEQSCKKSSSETSFKYPSDPKITKNPDLDGRKKTGGCEFSNSWAQAEDEFHAEDLKRKISREVRMKSKCMKRQAEEMERTEHLQSQCEELQKNVESRASSWKTWETNKKNVKMVGSWRRGVPVSVPVPDSRDH